jgi:hypothetical protein
MQNLFFCLHTLRPQILFPLYIFHPPFLGAVLVRFFDGVWNFVVIVGDLMYLCVQFAAEGEVEPA